MIIHWVMLVGTYIISCIGCNLSRKRFVGYKKASELQNQQKSISMFFAIVSMLLIIIFVGMRTDYADTAVYINSFNKLPTDINHIKSMYHNNEENIGFWSIALLIKKYISNDPNVWLSILAIFQAFSLARFYQKYSENFSFSLFLFVASGSVSGWMMNGLKQFTAACFILCFFDYIVNRKLIKFLFVVFIAFLFHQTALLWIPVYFIVKYKPFSWQIWVCVIATIVLVLFIDRFTTILNDTLEGTKYEGQDILQFDDGVNPVRVLVYMVPPAIALWHRKTVEYYNNSIINICINLATVSVGVYLVGVVTSGILIGRIPIYFELANYVLLPWLLKYTFKSKDGMLIKAACYFFYFVYFYYIMVVQGFGQYISEKLNLFYY